MARAPLRPGETLQQKVEAQLASIKRMPHLSRLSPFCHGTVGTRPRSWEKLQQNRPYHLLSVTD